MEISLETQKVSAKVIESDYTYKILVVDDDRVMLNLINRYFSDESYIIDTSLNGTDALIKIEANNDYDLILLDVMMPDINGYEVCKKIREKYALYELPIIIITARNMISDVIESFDSGANDYISKPFDKNELIARTQTLIKLKRLTQANNNLQEAVDIKNKFMQMTIHDLRNPLTIIIGLANLMKSDDDKDSDNGEYLSLILDSAELMLNMVNDLLDNAKVESGKLFLKKEAVNLNEVARNVIEKNRRHALQKEQKIFFTPVNENHSQVISDKIRIQEIMDNLISNAIKYSPKGSGIWVNIDKRKNGIKSYARFSVKDEGPGFTDEDKQMMFSKYVRLSALPTGGEPSSGLGLSIVKQLIDMLEGHIMLESEEGVGSTFTVEFPQK